MLATVVMGGGGLKLVDVEQGAFSLRKTEKLCVRNAISHLFVRPIEIWQESMFHVPFWLSE